MTSAINWSLAPKIRCDTSLLKYHVLLRWSPLRGMDPTGQSAMVAGAVAGCIAGSIIGAALGIVYGSVASRVFATRFVETNQSHLHVALGM
ncbi:MAG: hypothetical protein R3C53_22045 [Pirellulaceae bacterium]